MTRIQTLIAKGKATFEGVPRSGLAWDLAVALEAARDDIVSLKRSLDQALARENALIDAKENGR